MKTKFDQIARMAKGASHSNFASIDFILGGVQKGGTTALDYYLRSHPEICLAETKEVHFFDNSSIFRFPEVLRRWWYHSFFRNCPSSALKGEATPIYIYWPDSINRIHQYNPDIKLIFVFRDPVARAYSHWNMEVKRGNETRSFSECIRAPTYNHDPDRPKHRIFSYVDRGFYSEQMERVYRYFKKDQVLCLKQEELLENPKAVLNIVARHLQISPFRKVNERQIHSYRYDAKISSSDLKYLQQVYSSDIINLERITGLDAALWKSHKI